MRALYALLSATAFTVSLAGAAGAVDLHDPTIGNDRIEYNTLTIIENGQTRQIDLANGEHRYNVCTSCTIRLANGKEVQASGQDMVTTNGTSIAVEKFPKPGPQQASLPSAGTPMGRGDLMAMENAMPGKDPINGGSDD